MQIAKRKLKQGLARPLLALAGFLLLLAAVAVPIRASYAADTCTAEAGTLNGMDWQITANCELILGKAGQTQTLNNPDSMDDWDWPWPSQIENIKTARFAGPVNGRGSVSSMFSVALNLTSLDLSNFNTSNVTDMSSMFSNASSLSSLNLSNFNTSNVTDMSSMFSNASSLSSLNLSNFNTSNVTNMSYMFSGASSLTSLDLSNFNTSNVTDMSSMFSVALNLTSLDLSNFNTSNVTDMSSMFYNASSLTSLDLSNFNTSNVTNMSYMFSGASSLSSLNLSNFNTSNVTDMSSMFDGARSLTSLDLSNFNTSNVTNMSYMFFGASSLERLGLGENFAFKGATDLGGYWQYESTGETYTAAQLQSLYDGPTMAGWYKKVDRILPDTPLYEAHGLGSNNINEIHTPSVKFTGYCINANKHAPSGYYNKREATIETLVNNELLSTNDYGYGDLGNNMREALIALIYWAEKDGYYSQSDIWDYTNHYSDSEKKDTTGHRYADIPNRDSYKLYIYESETGEFQNLLTIEGLLDEPFGGVGISKTDTNGGPLAGAEFTIYNSGGSAVATFTTDARGRGGVYMMDEREGLSPGTYTIKETKAPTGYNLTSTTYTFRITSDQEFVTVTTSGGDITFTNDKDDNWTGGGVRVYKTGAENVPLAGAEFDVKNASGTVVAHLVTDNTGSAMTGIRDLPLGNYTVVETKAPAGYKLNTTPQTVNVNTDTAYGATAIFSDTEKTGRFSITAEKRVTNNASGNFTFELYATDSEGNATGSPLQTKTISGAGTVTFDAIEYHGSSDLGYVNYVIREKAGTDSSITYDTHDEFVTVMVYDNGGANLEFEQVNDEDGAVFTNEGTYHASGSAQFEVTKALSGRTLATNQFSFELKNEQGTVLQTKSNASNGKVTFDALSYNETDIGKTYTYTINEKTGNAAGYSYDSHVLNVSVKITDNGDGTLKTEVTYSGNKVFANTYRASGSAQFEATKALTGRSLAANQFSFELKNQAGTVLQTKKNAANGKVTFDPISYSEADAGKTYTYTITEKNENAAGYTYDNHTVTVTVKVTDNGNGTLKTDVSYSGNQTFTNAYHASGNASFEVTKALTGRTLAANQFSFELKNQAGTVLQTKQNAANGKVTFDPISYSEADAGKTYNYTITELNDNQAGYTYDEHVASVTVTITDNGDGTLKVVSNLNNTGSFANFYEADGSATLEVLKSLTGRKLVPGEFAFELKDSEGEVLQTVSNGDEGRVVFSPLAYTEADAGKTFSYTIVEKNTEAQGVTYDEHTVTATVQVSDNGDGTLSTEVSYDGDTSFSNIYQASGEAQLEVSKVLVGKELEADQFSFELKDEQGEVIQTVKNDAEGKVSFEAIKYNEEDVDKVYNYSISEKNDAIEGYTYDEHTVNITVKISDNGDGTLNTEISYDGDTSFTNSWTEEVEEETPTEEVEETEEPSDEIQAPNTGSGTLSVDLLAAIVAFGLSLTGLVIRKRT